MSQWDDPTHMELACRGCGATTFLTVAGGNINCDCDETHEQFDIRYFVLARETTLDAIRPRLKTRPAGGTPIRAPRPVSRWRTR